MTGRIAESDIESLINGKTPDDAGLEPLTLLLSGLRRLGSSKIDPRPSLMSELATIARDASDESHVARSQPARRRIWRPAPIMAVASAVFVLAGMTGVAAAADAAAPGDPLYGVDRALENIGIGDGGISERLTEAEELAIEGDAQAALAHAGNALAEAGDGSSADALLATAEKLRGQGSEASRAARASVADMLEWMATTEETGRSFGQGVAERAGNIGAKGESQPNAGQPGNSGNTKGNGDANGNGKGQGAGRPENTPPGRNAG